MGERVEKTAKTPEAKRENLVSHKQKINYYQSLNSPIDQILFLQRIIGNQAVGRMLKVSGVRGQGIGLEVQPKRRIGQPNDVYEQEADRVADTVMRMPEPAIQTKPG